MSLAPIPRISDEDAIRAAIFEETEAFRAMDIDRWAACWHHDESTNEVMIAPDLGHVINRGWPAIKAETEKTMRQGQGCPYPIFSQEKFSIRVDGDLAWITFTSKNEDDARRKVETFETRVMVRVDGRWLISFLSFVTLSSPEHRKTRLAVDGVGQVIWIEDAARAQLDDHPGLTISNGRLRAKRPAWDTQLQDAIARAAEFHGYFFQYNYMHRTGRGFRCPVVLGEDDNGAVLCCVLSVNNGKTFVDFETDEDLEDQLAFAAGIFNLSPAQSRLAGEIISGRTLTAAAEDMGISENTARTHLSRIFEKTGVNSQTSLVRILMSVG